MSEELHLSAATLAALKEFALHKGIVKDSDDSDEEVTEQQAESIVDKSSLDVLQRVRDHYAVKERDEIFEFKFGDIQFRLAGVKRELGQTLSSTGLTLWRAAEHLSQFCFDHADAFRGKTILELGAGIGVVSILLDRLGAKHVVASDGDEETVELLEKNIHAVKSNVEPALLYWGRHQEFQSKHVDKFDVLIAADVIYEDEQVLPLVECAVGLMRPDSVFYLAYARRNIPIDKVLVAAAEHGLHADVLDRGEAGQEPIYRFTIGRI